VSTDRVIGVDVGGTKILAGIVDAGGEVERHREYGTPTTSQEDLISALEQAVRDLLDDRWWVP
jgi:predicted NBD/HSP70 family sugar kinase